MASIKIQIEAGYDYPLLAALEQARVSINEVGEDVGSLEGDSL